MTMNKTYHNNSHQPVLLNEVLACLSPKKGSKYLDLTAGRGGHAKAVLEVIGAEKLMTLVDRDAAAVQSLQELKDGGARIIKSDFESATKQLIHEGEKFDMILIDLGVSSPQLDQADRGFSFQGSGPLDMRMDQAQEMTAAKLVNSASEDELRQILRNYGQEPHANRLAKMIVEKRPFETTEQLASAIEATIGRRGKRHPATRTFQAIRIAVNDELGQIERTLPQLEKLLVDGGRLTIISFHSLEDRLVKNYFKETTYGYEAIYQLVNKKAISGKTDVSNPRARSANLRAVAKIKK